MNNAKNDKQIIADQLKLMRAKLIEEGDKIPDEDLIVSYDNGGGQSGVRENPFYPAYEKFLASYIKTLTAYKDISGEEDAELESLDQFRLKIAK